MPIMALNWVVNEGMSTNAARIVASMNPGTSPIRAVRMGSPMATTDPKAMRRMMAAAITPMISEVPGGSCSIALATGPPSSTWKPSASDSSRRSTRASRLLLSISKLWRAYWVEIRAMVRSSDMDPR